MPHTATFLSFFSSSRIIQNNTHWKCNIRHEANSTLNLVIYMLKSPKFQSQGSHSYINLAILHIY